MPLGDDGERASLRHGLLGVEHQVEQCLLEQLLVEGHGRQVGGQVTVDVDVRLCENGVAITRSPIPQSSATKSFGFTGDGGQLDKQASRANGLGR